MTDTASPGHAILRRFTSDAAALAGLGFVIVLVLLSVYAPLLANGKPLLTNLTGSVTSPALAEIFAPDSQEVVVERLFNYLMAAIPITGILLFLLRKKKRIRRIVLPAALLLLAIPFVCRGAVMDKTDWRVLAASPERAPGSFAIFTPVPYGPFETSSEVYGKPSARHWCGTDQVGRDVFTRMLYGGRVSLAVGFLATLISLSLGTLIGLYSGYKGGKIDLAVQRLVEVVICFPTFLLLLILMAIMLDYGSRQSILLVILILGFTGWPGLCRLVRGEVLKQRQMAYIQSGESMGLPLGRILFLHLLPNVSAPIFVSCAFDIAGAILAENSLSFLGFGVQDPSASWGALLREAFADPLTYWNLMLWPGLAIFLTVASFNFIADGLRKAFDVKA